MVEIPKDEPTSEGSLSRIPIWRDKGKNNKAIAFPGKSTWECNAIQPSKLLVIQHTVTSTSKMEAGRTEFLPVCIQVTADHLYILQLVCSTGT